MTIILYYILLVNLYCSKHIELTHIVNSYKCLEVRRVANELAKASI